MQILKAVFILFIAAVLSITITALILEGCKKKKEHLIGSKVLILGDTLTIEKYEPADDYYILSNGLLYMKP